MPVDDAELAGPGYYREVAAKLRRIASDIRFDYRRAAQLRALADGFERLAERLAQKQ